MVENPDLDGEVGHLLLRVGGLRRGRVGDFAHLALEFAVAESIDRHCHRIAHAHVDDVVFVHLHFELHTVQIGDAQHLGAGELPRADDALAGLALERHNRAVDGRAHHRFAEALVVLVEHTLILLNRKA